MDLCLSLFIFVGSRINNVRSSPSRKVQTTKLMNEDVTEYSCSGKILFRSTLSTEWFFGSHWRGISRITWRSDPIFYSPSSGKDLSPSSIARAQAKHVLIGKHRMRSQRQLVKGNHKGFHRDCQSRGELRNLGKSARTQAMIWAMI